MKKLVSVVLTLGVLALGAESFFTATSSAQQPGWSWPEKAKNLKVLPKDTDPQKLRAVMVSFTHSLGVRCTHCHVGKEGQPLSTFDFPSDENRKKDIARGMMKMVDSINVAVQRIVPASQDRITVGCVTCHRGVARPRTLTDELAMVYEAMGPDSVAARYRAMRARYYGSGSYDFGEGTLGEVARHALDKKDYPGAIALLKMNVDQYPESGFAHGMLAEAYVASGDTTRAIAELERSMQLDPKNERTERMLKQLKGK